MKFLYRTGILLYGLFIRVASIYNIKAKQLIKGRKNWRNNLKQKLDTNSRYLWFHCASLGEFEQGRPMMEEIRRQFPHYRFVLTFFSPSGYEIRKNYELADVVMYLPFDTRKNAKDFIRLVQPEKAFFIKYEYWYYYIDELKKQTIPLYIISAIFRQEQQFFKNNFWGRWYRQILKKTTHIFVQDENSGSLLEQAGIGNYTISGDTRFDRVAQIAGNAKEIPLAEKFKNGQPLLIAGSTWKPDEEILVQYINEHNGLKMIIAQHEITSAGLNRLEQMINQPVIRLSQSANKDITQFQVLIIDSVGLLSSLYRYGNMAYIGGGFGVGIHNILEAATFGLPVVFGPNYKKFKEAVELEKLGGAFPVKNYNNLEITLHKLLANPGKLETASKTCKIYVANNVGSAKNIIKKVFNI
jgi:3-deoxy-D-manno-octulosonic-acid transferase